ncbi:hypothetical protein FACS1894127_5700 [Clostridia bacterium]|nr:hypothetical protein FACS1894127_5700 [Clostridia bacterium]
MNIIMKRKILITGCNGFIAKSLIPQLAGFGYELYGLSKTKTKSPYLTSVYQADITQAFKLDVSFDVIIHLAALNRVHVNAQNDYISYFEANVTGTKNVIECCRFERFVLFSTSSVYDRAVSCATEESPVKPISNYSISKLEAETVCKERIPDERLLIVRPINVSGENQEAIALLPVMFRQALSNQEINIFVPKNRLMQFLYVDDLTGILDKMIKNELSGLYNISSNESISIEELSRSIVDMCASKSIIRITNNETESSYIVSDKKLRDEISWYNKVEIKELLQLILRVAYLYS